MSELTSAGVIDIYAIEEKLARIRWKMRHQWDSEAAEHAAAEARANVLNLITVVSRGSTFIHSPRSRSTSE